VEHRVAGGVPPGVDRAQPARQLVAVGVRANVDDRPRLPRRPEVREEADCCSATPT
jgi:hypothetical protein